MRTTTRRPRTSNRTEGVLPGWLVAFCFFVAVSSDLAATTCAAADAGSARTRRNRPQIGRVQGGAARDHAFGRVVGGTVRPTTRPHVHSGGPTTGSTGGGGGGHGRGSPGKRRGGSGHVHH